MTAITDKLIATFKDRESFSKRELMDFFQQFDPALKEGTLGWRIYDLRQKGILTTVKRGRYRVSVSPEFQPGLSEGLLRIGQKIVTSFPEVTVCIWETSWLLEFLQHQSGKMMTLIEIEKGFEESLFFELKDSFGMEVYVNPQDREIDLYIAESRHPVVIRRLITRSPLEMRVQHDFNLPVPQLEKILVDVFTEEKLFHFLHGTELIHLFEHALSRYAINFTRLLSYASRRGRDQEIRHFLTNHVPHLVQGIIHD